MQNGPAGACSCKPYPESGSTMNRQQGGAPISNMVCLRVNMSIHVYGNCLVLKSKSAYRERVVPL